jgi:hypothetical protein
MLSFWGGSQFGGEASLPPLDRTLHYHVGATSEYRKGTAADLGFEEEGFR